MPRILPALIALLPSLALAATLPDAAQTDFYTVKKRVTPISKVVHHYDFTRPGVSESPEADLKALNERGDCNKNGDCVCENSVAYPEIVMKPAGGGDDPEAQQAAIAQINEAVNNFALGFRCDEGLNKAHLDFSVTKADAKAITYLFTYTLQPLGAAPTDPQTATQTYSLVDGGEITEGNVAQGVE